MQDDFTALTRIMRCQLVATNQQFTHILALRKWGRRDTADRIAEVDDVDFPNAMRIIDYLVKAGIPLQLTAGDYTPGTDYRQILVAEQAMERRIAAAIEEAGNLSESVQRFVEAAKEPRAAYSAWLSDRLAEADADNREAPPAGAETGEVVAHLVSLIEQSTVHAFVHWHAGDAKNADAAWATSGAAMMQLTEVVVFFAARASVPGPGPCPIPRIAQRSEEAHDLDRQLALLCAKRAETVADRCEDKALADLCGKIAKENFAFSHWSPDQPHPAANSNPAAFSSFEATLKRFVWSS